MIDLTFADCPSKSRPFATLPMTTAPRRPAENPPATAEQARPPDHGSRNRVEDEVAATGVAVDGVLPRYGDDPGHRCACGADREQDHSHLRHVDSGAPGGFGIAAHREYVGSERRVLRDNGEHERQPDENEEQHRHAVMV